MPGPGGGDQAPSRSAPAGPEHRTELVHDHHHLFVWRLDWPLILLALAGLAVLYPFARLPRRGQRAFGGAVAAGLLAFAVAAFAAGINPQPGPGTYEREPAEVERSDNLILERTHVHHFHEPIFLLIPWLTLGLGLAVLAIPAARVAAAGQPKSVSPDAEGATT